MRTPPNALTIAGSDPSGGAGVQADLKTFSALGAYGTSVITALTAQNTLGVRGVHQVGVEFVALQLDTLLADVEVDAVKIGMLATAALAHEIGRQLGRPELVGVPVVLDPVMVATSGSRLLDADATDAVRALLPLVDVITPNLPEAGVLLDSPLPSTPGDMLAAAYALRGLGARRVLLKGGHLASDAGADDLWLDDAGATWLPAPRVPTRNTHGTGCTLSSALAALRPRYDAWLPAVREAKAWLTAAIVAADRLKVGAGHGPVHHFHELSRWA